VAQPGRVADAPTAADVAFMREALAWRSVPRPRARCRSGPCSCANGAVIGRGWNRPIASHARRRTPRSARCAMPRNAWGITGSRHHALCHPGAVPMCARRDRPRARARVVYGARDPRTGAAGRRVRSAALDERFNHRVSCEGGVLVQPCGDLLRAFFRARRGAPRRRRGSGRQRGDDRWRLRCGGCGSGPARCG